MINTKDALMATLAGTAFLASFMLIIPSVENMFMDWSPSEQDDDVRFDLFIPIFGTTYLISSLLTYVLAKATSKVARADFSNKYFVRFLLFVPIIIFVAYMVIVAVLLGFLAIGLHNEQLDRIIVYFVAFASVITGYYLIMRSSNPVAKV